MDRRLGPLKPGDRFLKYEIRRLIGRGGHAYVYEAHDDFLNLQVAVKVIPSSADTGRDLAARARAEARVLVRLSHDNVVKVMDAGATDEGVVYLIMELLRGRDLRKALNQVKRLTVIETLRAAQQIADGVAAAHRLGAIHRDLKPENVFIEPHERFKVLDFGVAKVMGYGAPTTQRDLLHGTALYMSPEQLRGTGATAKSDMFALGTMLYEALHAHPLLLWGANVPNLEELGKLIIQAVPPPLNQVDPAVPSYVARLVQRAIAKKPEQRFADMEELSRAASAALDRYLSEARASGHEPVLRELSEAAAPATNATSAPGDTDVMAPPAFTSTAPTRQLRPSATLRMGFAPEVHIAETRTRPPVAETPPPTTSSAPGSKPQARRGTLLAVGAAVALGLVLGVGYALVTKPLDAPPTNAAVTATVTAPTPSPSPTPAAPPEPAAPPPAPEPAASVASASPRTPRTPRKPPAAPSAAPRSPAAKAALDQETPLWIERDPPPSKAIPDVKLPSSGLDD